MSAARFLVIAAVLACDSPTSSERDGNVETGRTSYVVEGSTLGESIVVDIRVMNPLSIPFEWGHCGGRPAVLYKQEGSTWRIVGSGPPTLDCGAPGEIIAPGAEYGITIQFHGTEIEPDGSMHFPIDNLNGTYRIVLWEVEVDGGDANPFGVVIHERYRTSNTFQVIES